MRLTLMGLDDSGHWYLCDEHGKDWRIVEGFNDYVPAAQLLGWMPVGSEHELAQNALAFLMDHIGEEFTVPKHVADYFREMQQDADQ